MSKQKFALLPLSLSLASRLVVQVNSQSTAILSPNLKQCDNATSPQSCNYTTVAQAFPKLKDLTKEPLYDNGRPNNVYLGGQDYNHCCLLAVNESLYVNSSGHIAQRSPPYNYIFPSGNLSDQTGGVQALFDASAWGQFPCGARYNGSDLGTPAIVRVPYLWVHANCPGWSLSDSKPGDESEWISPFTGFLLPAVVFCITIPRRRKLGVWGGLFIQDMSQIKVWIIAPFAAMLALSVVVVDTIIWLCMCFTFAGPMLVSGLMEAYLDKAMLDFVSRKIKAGRLTLDMRARILFIILVGNLDLNLDDSTLQTLLQTCPFWIMKIC